MKPQSIIELVVSNIKGIKAAEWRPKKGEINVVSGRNGQGKTSMLIALGMLFVPKKHWPKDPIRHGEEHGFIKLQTEDYKVELVVSRDKPSKLTVWKMIDGEFEKRTRPRTVLDSFCNGMAFSVTAFNGEADVLMELAGVTFDDLDEKHVVAYNKRTRANTNCKAAEIILEGMPYYEDAPTEEVSVTDLMAELDRITRHNSDINFALSNEDELFGRIDNFKKSIADYEKQMSHLEKDLLHEREMLSKTEEKYVLAKKRVVEIGDFESDAEPRAAIASASEVNDKVRANKDRVAQNIRVAELQKAAEEKDDAVKAIAASREERIRTSDMPLPKLGFDGDGRVTYGGVVFDDLSTSERIRVQLNIGAALNPKFRVITIEHGNDLDEDAKTQIAEFAAEHDVMVLAEMVGDLEGALVIEAGEVK